MADNKASMKGVQNDKNYEGSNYMGYRLSWLREQVADLWVWFMPFDTNKNESNVFKRVPQQEGYPRLRATVLNLKAA